MDKPLLEPVVNYKSLTNAIMKAVGMAQEEYLGAESMADHLLGFFGYQDRVIDNQLKPIDRNLFYQFQDWGLLDTESEETTLWDGRVWRIHYWKVKTERVVDTSFFDKEDSSVIDSAAVDIYTTLSDDKWRIETYNDDDSWLPQKREFDEY
jgi:hypothetical protein